MGRSVKIRVNYSADAGYLTRLAQAIARDDKRSTAWKREALTHLTKLQALFAQDLLRILNTDS